MASLLSTFLSSSPGPCVVLLAASSLVKLEQRLKEGAKLKGLQLTTEAKQLKKAKGHIFVDGHLQVKGRLVHRFVEEPLEV